MATRSFGSSPPPYDPISKPVSPIQFKLSSLKPTRGKLSGNAPVLDDTNSTSSLPPDSVLSRVRDLVSAPNFTCSSAAKIVDACAATLPSTAEFSDLLQTPNIEGHTALYWAIVNKRLEAFSALAGVISEFSSDCFSDLRHACMITNDQALFAQLNLGHIDAKDEPLTRSLGCLPDVIQVHEGDSGRLFGKRGESQFVVSFQIKMFQKRLRITQNLTCEFVAGGRIWQLRFFMSPQWTWTVAIGLSSPSFPACPKIALLIQSHKGIFGWKKVLVHLDVKYRQTLVPDVPERRKAYREVAGSSYPTFSGSLGDWVMHDDSKYIDRDGTLHVTLDMAFK